jgi:hypothetical protein
MYELLIKKIKEKKPLDKLEDKYVEEKINLFLKNNPKIKVDFTNQKNSNFKRILKEVRNELNKRYGIFWLSNELSLESHKSSKERLTFYKELYKKIFEITEKPETILDISSGLNPLSIHYADFKGEYIATELAKKDCDLLNEYFKQNHIKGKAIQLDLTKTNKFPKADMVFLFKVFDSVEEKGHKLAESIIKSLDTKYIIISFATTTARNRKMNFPNRGWIEQLLKRLNLNYKKLEFENEIFYVVKV